MYHDNQRGLNSGVFITEIRKKDEGWRVWNKNGCIYFNGKWAEKLEEPKFAESLEEIDRCWGIDVRLPTTELVEGTSALTQLLSFRHDVWEKEGKPEEVCWSIATTTKRGVEILQTAYDELPFSFKKEETAQWFLETHKELLIEYFNKLIK